VLRVIQLETGGVVNTVQLPIECEPSWRLSTPPTVLDNGAQGKILVVADGEVFRVDPKLGVLRSRTDIIGPKTGGAIWTSTVPFVSVEAEILGAALSDDGTALALTGHDGVLHTLDPDSLESRDPDLAIGRVYANSDTYLPSVESPVAIAPDGATMAFVDTMGRVALRRMTDGEVTVAFDGPFKMDGITPNNSTQNAPMAILLDTDRVTVAYQAGVASWGCVADASSGGSKTPLSVSILGPPKLVPEEGFDLASLSVTVGGGDGGPVIRRLSLATVGDVVSYASLGPDLNIRVFQPGQQLISAIADDGVQTSTTSMKADL
jgi:hypothetical protein